MCDGRDDDFDSGGGVKNTVTIVTTVTLGLGGVQGTLFKGWHCWVLTAVSRATTSLPSRRAQRLLMADGCQKCFCVTLDKSNRTLPAIAGQ